MAMWKFVPHKTFEIIFFFMRVTYRPKLIRVLSMPKVPNTAYAVDLHRATHISAANQNPCFVQFRVKLMSFTE